MLTLRQAVEDRQRNLLLLLAQTLSIGKLYRVPESVWQAVLVRYDRASTRTMHPGLSLSGPRSTLDAVPMLHGTSGHAGSLVFKGLFPGDPAHQTSFGRLLAPVPLHAWQGKDGVGPLHGARPLNEREIEDVRTFAKQRGWL